MGKRMIFFIFITVPVIFSIISTIHLISFANLGNPYYLSVMFAGTVELGAIVTFITISPTILERLNKNMILYMFILLFGLQAMGNMYSVYDYILLKTNTNSEWLNTIDRMTLGFFDNNELILIVSLLLGLVVPLFSIILLKAAVDYLGDVKTKSEDIEIEEHKVTKVEPTVHKVNKSNKKEEKSVKESKNTSDYVPVFSVHKEREIKQEEPKSEPKELNIEDKLKKFNSEKTINVKK